MKSSENINEIAKAVSLAQGEIKPAAKDSINPHFKNTFSSLSSIRESIREPLSKHGLSLFQDVMTTDLGIAVSTRICHLSGQWLEFGPLEISLARKDAQAIGSATSYAKRYALCACLGIVSGDDEDDGNEAVSAAPPANSKKAPPKNKTITEGQAKELDAMLGMCDLEFRNQVWNFLNSDAVGIKEMKQLPEALYQKIRDKIDNKINAAGKDEVKDE